MADDSEEDKTEPASGRKIEKAREEGSVAKSQELTSFAAMIIGGSALIMLGPRIFDFCKQIMIKAFSFNHSVLQKKIMTEMFAQLAIDGLLAITPFLILLMLTAIGATISMTGFLFTWNAVTPKLSKLDPISGMKRVFSIQGLVQLGLSLLKAGLVGSVAWIVISKHHLDMLGLIRQSTEASYLHVWEMMIWTFIWISSSMILLVGVDVPYQLWQYAKNMRMTKQEVKDEAKESEGNPEIKAKIKSLQRQMARRRMMASVPSADVIVTNPTHYAVALKYDGENMSAPQVVAKGVLDVAERIIETGRSNRVPVLRSPPLARALYHSCEIDQEIPGELYTAVAEVLAYVYQLRRFELVGGVPPQEPNDLEVPKNLDPGEKSIMELRRVASADN